MVVPAAAAAAVAALPAAAVPAAAQPAHQSQKHSTMLPGCYCEQQVQAGHAERGWQGSQPQAAQRLPSWSPPGQGGGVCEAVGVQEPQRHPSDLRGAPLSALMGLEAQLRS